MKRSCRFNLKIISLFSAILICVISLFGYKEFNQYKYLEQKYTSDINDINNETKLFIKTILIENRDKSTQMMEYYTKEIQDDIKDQYKNNDQQLKNDINKPTEDSKLSHLFNDKLSDLYMNKDDQNNKIFIGSEKQIIWNSTNMINSFSYTNPILWENLLAFSYNESLATKAKDALLYMNYENKDFIYWQSISSDEETVQIENMDIDDIYDLYTKYGLDSLKHYELLVPSYITKNGDIFGNHDIDNLGNRKENYKLVLVQRINIYDALSKYNLELKNYSDQLDGVSKELYSQSKQKMVSIVEIIFLALLLLFVSAYIQNTSKFNLGK